ncbi:MAG: heparinase II/III family protein, partial [Pirellulaceae bacterium]|nr:heparinase II/III family protein [Pirellulaceae bacterium]
MPALVGLNVRRTFLVGFYFCCLLPLFQVWAAGQSGLPGRAAELLRATAQIRQLDEAEVIALVPTQSGLNYIDCPNCTNGRQENQLTWSPDRPEQVVCKFCRHRYPSADYPMNKVVEVSTPTGKPARFPYWEDASGYRHFFEAKRNDEARMYMAQQAQQLGELYTITGDRTHARRAAIILSRFAELFPDWCFHYDYPFKQKEIYDGPVMPRDYRTGFRTARWTWWAYRDIPMPLIECYAAIRSSDALSELSRSTGRNIVHTIEHDLIRSACEQVLANPETYSNMSPAAWQGLVLAGRVLPEPRYVHEVTRRLQVFVNQQFFYDGVWSEGSPDYGRQSVNGLDRVVAMLEGYSDPAGYLDPKDHQRFDDLDLNAAFPSLSAARRALRLWHLPNGRTVPVHDTWSTSRGPETTETHAYLLPAVGHACLGGGIQDRQTQFHLTWSGGYGHSHGDNLSLLLFADGRERLSDLGYTHTAYRSWTLATAAHNTVVIDGQQQSLGKNQTPTDGVLLDADLSDPLVQHVYAEGGRGYPARAQDYRRRLIVIRDPSGHSYAIDRFDVAGGATHDYFLHGDADGPGAVSTSLPLVELASLLPEGMKWTPTTNEGETGKIATPYYAYGFLKRLRTAQLPKFVPVPISFRVADAPSVNVWLIPQSEQQLVLGENPSIRQALENDAELEKHHRPFMMVRSKVADSGSSRFVALLEPAGKETKIRRIEQVPDAGGATLLRIELIDRVDWVVIQAQQPVEIKTTGLTDAPSNPTVTFQGDVGVLSMLGQTINRALVFGQGKWQFSDHTVTSQRERAPLVRIETNKLVINNGNSKVAQPAPTKGSVVRLTTQDGWCYPYTVLNVTT